MQQMDAAIGLIIRQGFWRIQTTHEREYTRLRNARGQLIIVYGKSGRFHCQGKFVPDSLALLADLDGE
jgi:hypothetical protein